VVEVSSGEVGPFGRDQLMAHCLRQPEAKLTRPFGDDVMVFKVAGKMFALVPDGGELPSISLKGDPLDNQELRRRYGSVGGGYHLNKDHWNTVTVDGEVPADELGELVEDSYDLVVDGLPKKHKLRLQAQVDARDEALSGDPPGDG
jgi:predicted DNA-binding protein (MmcQ/YjbR family)